MTSTEPCRHYQQVGTYRIWCAGEHNHAGAHKTIAGNSGGVWHYVMPKKAEK